MGQALYRKHRPKSLKDVVGQEHITKTLEQALKSGRISHAYLFTGPKGVGKTSVARILAHAINDLPYGEGDNHIDIIEIDAASNRRIDEIRELRDKVYVAPASAKYKVYIIDEVHMLTREAFNALLKTLEEPPAHVVFILATTDAHKLPETIISRTQRFTFKPVGQANVAKLLKDMAKAENVTISDEALELLAAHGEGSFRDSISLLDQASNYGEKLEVQDIQQLLGLPPAEAVASLATALPSESPAQLVQRLSDLYEQGYQAAAIA
ncbi:MAG TPA: DNA polymerase III subunit gamma/tau, partial [Candidatus Saccharimonadales bacterium]|nr:DNA polymerase III subunit gamma/tau [Candidatus Saccharimonadales bacterium]